MIWVYYPSKDENTTLFDFCYSFEKILSRNFIQKRNNVSEKIKSFSRDISRVGVNKTRGALMNNIINQYKTSNDSFFVNVIPNKLYCLSGYWIEKVMPGTFESLIYEKSKKTINEFKDFKEEVDGLINNFNSGYQNIREELNSIF
tara:strand:+ start:183 stop:617 length:435 start_codon:yes stop_codon:yes gene_type:complete